MGLPVPFVALARREKQPSPVLLVYRMTGKRDKDMGVTSSTSRAVNRHGVCGPLERDRPLRARRLFGAFLVLWLAVIGVGGAPSPAFAQEGQEPQAVTTDDPTIPANQLELLLQPLTKDELIVEAEAWQALVQEKAQEIAEVEVKARQHTAALKAIEDAEAAVESTSAAVQAAETALAEARAEGDAAAIAEAEEALEEARVEAQEAAEAAARAAEVQIPSEEERSALLEEAAALREERTLLVDNLTAVVDELFAKTHADDGDTQAAIQDYRLYISGVSGLNVEVDDASSAWIFFRETATSEQGGIRWAQNLALVVVILLAGWVVSKLFSRGVRRGLRGRGGTSQILEDFLVGLARWVIMGIAVIMALSALEVSTGPLLAIVGAAGFAIAFALQDSLGNIASGILILIFRPFDTGDVVDAGGVSGTVDSLNLVSTTLRTFDNKRMILPNNKIWSDVITNVTDVTTRRVDLEFGISYSDDIDRAAEILNDIVAAHEKVLDDPAPVVRMHAMADSSVNFICRPWVNADDYWAVYWDIMREVKLRFDKEGINIPFPQRDVHLYIKQGGTGGGDVLPASGSGAAAKGPIPQPLEPENPELDQTT